MGGQHELSDAKSVYLELHCEKASGWPRRRILCLFPPCPPPLQLLAQSTRLAPQAATRPNGAPIFIFPSTHSKHKCNTVASSHRQTGALACNQTEQSNFFLVFTPVSADP